MAKIFLVDDEPNIIKVLSQILQDEEHIIFSASNGTEALEFLKKNEPDLIFLDVWLPDADGLQLLETIKKEKPLPRSRNWKRALGKQKQLLFYRSKTEHRPGLSDPKYVE